MYEIISDSLEAADLNLVRSVEGFENIHRLCPAYLSDESKLSGAKADGLYFPENEAELATVLKEMRKKKTKVTVSAARTGLVGGCVPDSGVIVSMERFNRIMDVYFDTYANEWRIRAQACIALRELNERIARKEFPEIERDGTSGAKANLEKFRGDDRKYFYPPDPTELSASLGGTVATNASGARTYRYGPTRNWVRGVRVMLATGEILDVPRGKVFVTPSGEFTIRNSKAAATVVRVPDYPLPKTKFTSGLFVSPGMDLIDLFIGSEGILGIITQVDVALTQKEEKISVVQFLESDEQAVEFVHALRADTRLRPDFIEFYSARAMDLLRERQKLDPRPVGMPPLPDPGTAAVFFDLFFDSEGEQADFSPLAEVAASCGASIENSWSGYEVREQDRFKAFRHILPETINSIIADRKKHIPQLHKLGTDLAVPDNRLKDMWRIYRDSLDSAKLEWVAFGHIGNNHIHINVLPRSMKELESALSLYIGFAEKVVEFGGSVSAEHGIGKMKKKFLNLMYSPDQIEQMRKVKRALDPDWLLNPGNIIDP